PDLKIFLSTTDANHPFAENTLGFASVTPVWKNFHAVCVEFPRVFHAHHASFSRAALHKPSSLLVFGAWLTIPCVNSSPASKLPENCAEFPPPSPPNSKSPPSPTAK